MDKKKKFHFSFCLPVGLRKKITKIKKKAEASKLFAKLKKPAVTKTVDEYFRN